ncbi:2376_t:CDS:2 [Rhizophagus irregularis]|nr:2376_t:CDS:2 [Rhizophagus irregularis]
MAQIISWRAAALSACETFLDGCIRFEFPLTCVTVYLKQDWLSQWCAPEYI